MDSGNSSSMQSSSGGDDQEYDSRSFFPTIPPPPPPPPPPQPQPPLNNPNLLFNPTFLNPFSDRDLFTWPPPPPPPPPPLLRSDPTNYLSFSSDFPTTPSSSSAAAPPPPPPPPKPTPGPIKNPKKRTRASRRAPTTILTTDTTNFRAMVQEFTGIPDPPFSGAGSVYSRRLDLLGSAGSSMRLAAALAGGPLRPTAQRLPPANSTNNSIQELISQTGSGRIQPDPVLAFQTLLNQSNHQIGYQPQPAQLHNAAFGMNIGLLGSDNHLSDAIGLDPHQHQHGRSTANNENSINYVMSCGAITSSPSSTDLIRPEGDYRNE